MILTDAMYDYNLRAGDNINPPVMGTPVVNGTPGSTEYKYCCSFVTLVGETTPTDVVTVSNGPAALNGVDFIRLSIETVPAAATKTRWYKYDSGVYKLLGETLPAVKVLDDSGQALSASVLAPITDTSGRPNWVALLFHHGRYLQRQELVDLQWLLMRGIKNIGDTLMKNGDIINGCAEQFVSGTTWNFTEGKVYLDGQQINVPAGQVTLTGTGTEVVGILVTPHVVTSDDDPVIRNQDEEVDLAYAQRGADRLTFDVSWVVDTAGQVNIRTFLDGQPLVRVFTTERSELQKEMARRTYDVSGNFVVTKFPAKMTEHDSDADKLYCVMGPGKAYVQGVEIATVAPQKVEVPKARVTKSVNESIIDAYSTTGGSVIGTATENFDVDGLNVKLMIGSGNSHTVALSGNGQTAAQVATQIENSVNAYPTSVDLVSCQGVGGKLQITAASGKSLAIMAVASDAYTALGLTVGVYQPTGQRIYQINDAFIKSVSDVSYLTEVVEAVTHNGGTGIDLLGNDNVHLIYGASNTEADAHDGKYDFVLNVDFVKNGNSIDFAALGGSDPANGATIYVKYSYSKVAVKGTRVRVRVTDAQIVKGAEDSADNIVFTGATSAAEVISGNPVAGLSGSASNVIRILRVNNSPAQSQTEYTSHALLKNDTALGFSTSQVDWSAAGAQGSTPLGQPTTGATYYVTFEYWKVVTEGDYVAADSYLNDYEEIEKAPNGTWELRDCMDFRTSGAKPIPEESPGLDYEYYLSRVDKIALKSDGYFIRISGSPALNPVQPKDQSGPLNILLVTVPPYTYQPSDVVIETLEIQRVTQWGLNEMKLDIDRLKYYQALFAVQQAAVSNPAASEAKGIFTDSLVGQKNGDVAFDKNGVAFTAAVDPTEQCLRLPVSEDGQTITINEAASTGFARVGKLLVFDYDPYTYTSQLKASGIMNVNPHNVFGWIGTMSIDPESDFWTDTTQIPALDTNYDDQMAALAAIDAENAERARQITWGAWRMTWDHSGGFAARDASRPVMHNGVPMYMQWLDTSSVAGSSIRPNAARERTGTYSSLVPDRTLVEVGDRVVDVTALPYMRAITINCVAKSLMPNEEFGCEIDGVAVDITPTGTTSSGVGSYKGKTTVVSNAAGAASYSFVVPEGITVGQKAIKCVKADNPEESYAISVFSSHGFLETHQKLLEGVISVTERDEVVTQNQWHYGDPLAQTFAVASGIVWLSAVKLYFQSKDANLPITVEIRETLNGYPTRKVIQTCTLDPSAVNVSDDASVATTFTFPNIVGYQPGEYCFVVITNCQTYNVWYAGLGETDIKSGELIRQQPHDGVLFTSPNDSYWEGEVEKDLMFEVLSANFENNCQVVFNDITGVEASMLIVAITQYMPEGCNMLWFYSLDNGSNWIPFLAGIDTELGSIATSVKLRCDITGSGGTFQISESGAGIILLLNKLTADYIGYNAQFDSTCDTVTLIADLSTDGVNGSGVRSITPYYTVDDGETWCMLKPPSGYFPIAVGDGTYSEWKFQTASEATITDATNATPIVVTAPGHLRTDNEIVDITNVVGNTAANGTFRVANATDDTFELVNPDTGADIAGNGGYVSGGTIVTSAFSQCRMRINLATSNKAVTPKVQQIRGICG